MATLAALGALDRFEVFAKPLNLEYLAQLNISSASSRIRIEDAISILDAPGAKPNPELRDALVRCLENWVRSLSAPKEPNFQPGNWRSRLWPEKAATVSTES
jgi:hypothetical protein